MIFQLRDGDISHTLSGLEHQQETLISVPFALLLWAGEHGLVGGVHGIMHGHQLHILTMGTWM